MFSGHIIFSGGIVVCFGGVVVFSWMGLVCLGSDVFWRFLVFLEVFKHMARWYRGFDVYI